MRQYQKHLEKNARNTVMSLNIMKQAAQDLGGQFTNKQEITGAGGGPLQSENVTPVTATDEQIRQAINELESEY